MKPLKGDKNVNTLEMDWQELIAYKISASETLDKHEIAYQVIGEMSQQQAHKALLGCLVERIRVDMTRVRLVKQHAPASQGPSRWLQATREHVFVNGERMFLEDCTVEDLYAVADSYDEQSLRLQAKATEFREQAALLAASGCRTLGEMAAREFESLAA